MLHLHILASGSKGNAAIVEGPQGSLLIDCGLSRKELFKRAAELGLDMSSVLGLLLTHEHSDHVSGVSVLANSFEGALFATAGTVAARSYLSKLPFTLIDDHEEFEFPGIRVKSFPTSHDVANPCGFCFEAEKDRIGYCTDTGVLLPEAYESLFACRILALESNHDEAMLRSGPYPGFLKDRVASDKGHLSNRQAAEALPHLIDSHTETVVAMHLSQENNRPSLAVRALAQAIGAECANTTFTEARTPDGHVSICAAGQDRPMSIW